MENKIDTLKRFTCFKGGWASEIQEIDNMLIATDRYILISTDGNLDNEPNINIPKSNIAFIKKLLESPKTKSLEINSKKVLKELQPLRNVKQYNRTYKDCEDCDCSGVVTWTFKSYENEDDCPVCDGDGRILTNSEFKGYGFKDHQYIEVFENSYLKANLLIRLMEISDKIILKNGGKDMVSFEIENYKGVIMEYRANNSDHSIYSFIN